MNLEVPGLSTEGSVSSLTATAEVVHVVLVTEPGALVLRVGMAGEILRDKIVHSGGALLPEDLLHAPHDKLLLALLPGPHPGHCAGDVLGCADDLVGLRNHGSLLGVLKPDGVLLEEFPQCVPMFMICRT